jgi:OTU-like cysteine protease
MPWFTQQKGMNMTTNNGRTGAIVAGTVSTAQIGLGLLMSTTEKWKIPGWLLINSGFGGAVSAFQQKNFEWLTYTMQTLQGGFAGILTSAFGHYFPSPGTMTKISSGFINGVLSTTVSEASQQLVTYKAIVNPTLIAYRAVGGGLGGTITSATATGFNLFSPATGTWLKIPFESVKSAFSAMAGKVVTNLYEKKKPLTDVMEVGALSATFSGLIASVEEWKLSKEMSKIQEQKAQAEKALKSAQENKAKHEANLKRLEQMNEKQCEILAAKKEVAEATKQLAKTEAQSKQMLQSYEFAKKSVSKEVKSNLARGNRAIINHKNTQDAHLISEALLNGQKVIWVTNDPYRPYIHRSSNPFRRHYESTQRYVQEIQQEIVKIEQSIAQNQAALTVLMQCKPGEPCISTYSPAQVETLQAETAKLQKQLETESLKIKELDLLARSQRLSKCASLDFQGVRIERLIEVFQKPAISYVDCDMHELIKHIILVHAVCGDTIERFPGFLSLNLNDASEIARFLVERLFAPDGTFGLHLQMEKRAFSGEFVFRPQIHWAWNQLVQANSGAFNKEGWERPSVIILEPLSVFENSTSHQPYAVSPYDTQIFGSIRLSKESTILVPTNLVNEFRGLLTDYQGQIIGYEPSKNSRIAVMETLSKHYPQTWHVCNPEGELLGGKAHYTVEGFETKTCLKTHDGKIIVLLHKEGIKQHEQTSQAMQAYHKAKRFIGLHLHSTTYWLEKKPYFQVLKQVLADKESLKKEALFAGHPKNHIDAEAVGVLSAFAFYRRLLEESTPQTGCYEVANYALKEAIFADIMSLFFQMNPEKDFTLTNLDLQMIVSPVFSSCKRLFLQMEHYANSDQKKAQEVYGEYCDLLKGSLRLIEQAQEETKNSLPAHSKQTKVDFAQADAIWDAVTLPEEIACDLGKNWPLPSALQAYVSKVFQLLPKEAEGLNACYQQLCHEKSTTVGPKEQYRLNVLCSATAYATQEQIYLKILDQNIVSPLATLFATHEEWLKVRHLETADFTKKIGDCLFDNIIAQVPELSSKTAQELRAMLVKFMADHADEYQTKPDFSKDNFLEVGDGAEALYFTDWKSYLEVLGKPQVWATELEIQAVSMLLQRPIVLVSAGGVPKIYHEQSPNVPIFLNHKNWNHYESCRPLSPHTAQEIYQMIKQEPHY